MSRRLFIAFSFCLILVLGSLAPAETIRVAVAISLKESLTDIARAYETRTGDKIELSFGASGQLATQIKSGAPVDAFISAAEKHVDDLDDAGLIDATSRRVIAGNTLVLIVPAESKLTVDAFDKLKDVSIRRIAIGEPKSVPAGQYAVQTLKNLKLSDAVKAKLDYGANVRQVLDYVVRGEVSAGIVYATDAKEAGEKVRVAATAPAGSHDPIVYPAAVIKKSARAAAAVKFLDHLGGDDARRALQSRGFTLPAKSKNANATHAAGGKP